MGQKAEVMPQFTLPNIQTDRYLHPQSDIEKDYNEVYNNGNITVGWPKGETRIFEHLSYPNTAAVLGIALGDEGKGRLVDNKITQISPKVQRLTVIRGQGGSNAGHTVEINGNKVDLHQIPSGAMYPGAECILDRGMVVHGEDLQTEHDYVHAQVGDLTERLHLSADALLATDYHRAAEVVFGTVFPQDARGGTGRGIGEAYATGRNKTGLRVHRLLEEDWKTSFGERYDWYANAFDQNGSTLADIEIPDFRESRIQKKKVTRKVGSKKEFLDRLGVVRAWLLKNNIVENTYLRHREIGQNLRKGIKEGVIYEGSQAAGLDVATGTLPDNTASNTRMSGIEEGTAYWRSTDIAQRIGVMKLPYTSSVGSRRMPTHIDIPEDISSSTLSKEQEWAAWVREEAHEYGTTTGRPRDINYLDLGFIAFNAKMSGIEVIVGTHLDIAREDDQIRICTHYEDKDGKVVPYVPGLRYQKDVIPQYIDLPGWDGKACQKAKSFEDLPINAQKYLSFVQRRTGYPIVAVTTGPDRSQIISFPGYE